MKIKRYELEAIRQVINMIGDKKAPIKTQYKIVKLKKIADEEQQIYQDLIDKNCSVFLEKDEAGNPIPHENGGFKIQEGKVDECNKVISDLLETEVEIGDFKFGFDELEVLDLTIAQTDAFMPIIEE